jgi:hypothetical protein
MIVALRRASIKGRRCPLLTGQWGEGVLWKGKD